MLPVIILTLAAAVGAASAGPRLNQPLANVTSPKISHTYQTWDTYRGFAPSQLAIDYIQEVQYGFFGVVQEPSTGLYIANTTDYWGDFQKPYDTPGDSPVQGNIGEFFKLKNAGYRFNLQLLIGGWTFSPLFGEAVRTAQTRDYFTNSIVQTLTQYPIFTGVNFNWEQNWYTYSDNAANYLLMTQLLRQKLAAVGLGDLLIQHSHWASYNGVPNMDPAQLAATFDEIFIMTYNFNNGAYYSRSDVRMANNLYPSSAYATFSVSQSVAEFTSLGISPSKLYIGVQLHVPVWAGVSKAPGMGQQYNQAVAQPSYDFVYAYQMPPAGCTEYWDNASQAAWCFSPKTGMVYQYENSRSALAKLNYVKSLGLGGIFTWDSSMDFNVTDSRSILATFIRGTMSVQTLQEPQWPIAAALSDPTTPTLASAVPSAVASNATTATLASVVPSAASSVTSTLSSASPLAASSDSAAATQTSAATAASPVATTAASPAPVSNTSADPKMLSSSTSELLAMAPFGSSVLAVLSQFENAKGQPAASVCNPGRFSMLMIAQFCL